jgi:hypothetical protein
MAWGQSNQRIRPVEKLFAGPEYQRSFVRRGSKWKTTTNPVVPQGPEYVSVAGNFIGNRFGDPDEDVIVSFGADPDGKIDPAGSLGCGGTYFGMFATHR